MVEIQVQEVWSLLVAKRKTFGVGEELKEVLKKHKTQNEESVIFLQEDEYELLTNGF